MKDVLTKGVFYSLLFVMIFTGVFFIIHNATWLVGDDSACITHTGWGNPYSLSDSTIPETGRFYPLAFVMYNILPILGLSSVSAHFTLHSIIFCLMLLCICWVCWKSIDKPDTLGWIYMTLLAVTAICFARSYRYFLSTEWSLWVDYFLIVIWTLSTYYVHKKQSTLAAIIGFISITYFCYCLEVNSAIPFSYGFLGLVLLRKNSTRLEKTYYVSMIITAALYFVFYYFLIYLNLGDKIYDSSHGVQMSIFEIAVRMFYAQKIFWVGIILLALKILKIFKRQASFDWWDILILSGFAYYVGCVAMHLHHTVYHWTAALCMLPAVIHYLSEWLGSKWSAIIMLVLALIMCHRLPRVIMDNQSDRIASIKLQEILKSEIQEGKDIFYFAPYVEDDGSNPYEHRQQKMYCLPSYIGNAINNHEYKLKTITEFTLSRGIYILPEENECLIPGANDLVINAGQVIFKGGYGNLTLVMVK